MLRGAITHRCRWLFNRVQSAYSGACGADWVLDRGRKGSLMKLGHMRLLTRVDLLASCPCSILVSIAARTTGARGVTCGPVCAHSAVEGRHCRDMLRRWW